MRRRGHYHINVKQAMALYAKHGTWKKVAAIMKRLDGSRYTAEGLRQAVSRYNRRG